MNFELQSELFRRYPKVYRKPRDVSDGASIDERGIECGDGWFELVDRLSSACEREIVALISGGMAPDHCPRVRQIKEKLGTLRFYIFGPLSDDFRELCLHISEVESRRTCEQCGAAKDPQVGILIDTLCRNCNALDVASGIARAALPRIGDEQYRTDLLALLDSRAT
jgi:hypothetical protein